ncbi:hypothetical protein ElyMa_000012300 [Elysia marginata]|uniref:Uncharacterized protein n=1 Tax=Elysia marginata TaxID=1093978 RepID=A0AAV4EB40_9GAST|nr:hypothetical protein ElyMa_000012300 [Elysia marginata]
MDMGHLYHDAVYGDPILALDVKEQLRTRELNACEEINLARKSQIYDRAKDLCEKTANHEKWRVDWNLKNSQRIRAAPGPATKVGPDPVIFGGLGLHCSNAYDFIRN